MNAEAMIELCKATSPCWELGFSNGFDNGMALGLFMGIVVMILLHLTDGRK